MLEVTLDGPVEVPAGEVDGAHVADLPRLKDLVADLLPHKFQALQAMGPGIIQRST